MRLLLAALLCLLPCAALAQIDPLAVTLPTGKIVHFQTAEQKAQYLAALNRPQSTVASGGKSSEQADAEWKKSREDERRYQDLYRRSADAWFKVIQFMPDGVIARFQPCVKEGGSSQYAQPVESAFSPEFVFLACQTPASWVDGHEFMARAYGDGTFSYTTVLGANSRIRRLRILERGAHYVSPLDQR